MFPLYFLYDVWAVMALRIVLGGIFIVHGWAKVRDLKQNAKNFEGMGFLPGKWFGTAVAFLEFFGGIALIVGIFMLPVSILFIIEFVFVLLWRFKKRMPFVGGWEFDALILAGVFVLFSLGGGAWSLDRLLFGIL